MARIRITAEAVRYDARSFHWEPMARYCEDATVAMERHVETNRMADVEDAVATLAEEFPWQCKMFATVVEGRAPGGFKKVRSWGGREDKPVHPHYAAKVTA